MLFFAHSGHDHGSTTDTLGATTPNGSDQTVMVVLGVMLITTAIISTVYFLKQRSKNAAEKTS
jgi:hypothetical protein